MKFQVISSAFICVDQWEQTSLLAENRTHSVGVLQIKQRWSDLIVIECGVLAVLALSQSMHHLDFFLFLFR